MSIEDDFEQFMENEEGITPEQVFKMVTILPKEKVRITAHLEDEEGEKIELATLAKKLTEYVQDHLTKQEATPVNRQLFPLINQWMISCVPRSMGMQLSAILLTAKESRYALSDFGLCVSLMMQYIKQHNLKIVTEETPITEMEYQEYLRKEEEATQRLSLALTGAISEPEPEESN